VIRVFFGRPCFEHHRAQKSYNQSQTFANLLKFATIASDWLIQNRDPIATFIAKFVVRYSFRIICVTYDLFISVENLGKGTSIIASRKENSQINMNNVEDTDENVLKEITLHSCFMILRNATDEILEETENVKIHVPILCVAQQICEACAGIEIISVRCRWCGVREFIFRRNPVKEFVDFANI